MAEVIITLGIIGIVSAMTIPTLINNYAKKSTISELKKVYSTLAQAIKLSQVENGDMMYWDFVDMLPREFFEKYLASYLKVGSPFLYSDISSEIKYYRPNGSVEKDFTFLYDNAIIYILSNGVALFFSGVKNVYTGKHVSFLVDINGYKNGPNRFGRDVFVFTIHRDHGVMPYGYDKTSDTDKYQELDRDTLLNSPRYGCRNDKENTSTNGAYCFGLIFFDNWEIKDDYPW